MRRPWFKAQPVDETFFQSAPFVVADTFAIPRPAAQVWADLTADDALHWCKIISRLAWTSPRPFGVGTTREVASLGGTSVLHEHFFRWEEGRRKSFYVTEASAPLFKSMAEDYLVEPDGEQACRFSWTIAATPRMPAALADPVNRRLLGTLFRDTRRHYGAG